jgi:hypothetical protein
MATPPVWPPYAPPAPPELLTGPPGRRPRKGLWIAGVVVLAMAAAGAGAAVTYALAGKDSANRTFAGVPASTPMATPQINAGDAAQAKENLCHLFDVSVRGQEGQGGLRVEGNLNVPVVLRSLNSAVAVENALAAAVPPAVADAARRYVSATVDQTTAAMSNLPASEGNRLTNVRNEAIGGLLDACGLPR